MVIELKNGYKPFSEDSANRRLRWFIEFLKEDTWKDHPYFKIVTAWQIEDILRCAGYGWHADRVKNHLHRWMKSISLHGDLDGSQTSKQGFTDFQERSPRLDKDCNQKKDLFFRSENGQNKANLRLIQAVDGRDLSPRGESETRFVAKKEFRLQRCSADTLREKRIQ